MACAARHESLVLLQPTASVFECLTNVPPSPHESNHQQTSKNVSVSEEKALCIWDAFYKLKSVLLESTEPATSDLLCLAHLEDRLRQIFPHK